MTEEEIINWYKEYIQFLSKLCTEVTFNNIRTGETWFGNKAFKFDLYGARTKQMNIVIRDNNMDATRININAFRKNYILK